MIVDAQPSNGGKSLGTLFPVDLIRPNDTVIDASDETLLEHAESLSNGTLQTVRRHLKMSLHPFWDSLSVYKRAKDYIPVKFVHLYNPLGIRTNLFCNILPNTPNSCQASMAEDAKPKSAHKRQHVNDGTNDAERIWYDQMVCAAAEAGLISTSTTKRPKAIAEAIRQHQHVWNQTILDFPPRCPLPSALYGLFAISWQRELDLLGDAHANATLHAHVFRKNIRGRKYCNIDYQATLKQAHWRGFFARERQE